MKISLEPSNTPMDRITTYTTKTTITSFDEVLETTASQKHDDKVTMASELTVEELAQLYIELGITSPAGVSETTTASAGTTVKVPSELVSYFENASNTYGVSYDLLVSVACAESNFRSDCTSSSGAMGIMQLMPPTAKYVGVTNAYDAEQNIMGGAKYLAEKLEKHGSVKIALAAYNAGSGAVAKYNGVPPYAETQNYIKKILGYLGTDGSESGLSNSSVQAAATDMDNTLVKVGEDTMTYQAYLRYLELNQV